jgi:ferric-dicitrate binding protein FerR (iron transport regulator)
LSFNDQPLQEIVDEINRYNQKKIQIINPGTACRISGLIGVPATDPDYIARKLQRTGIVVTHGPEGTINLNGSEPRGRGCVKAESP